MLKKRSENEEKNRFHKIIHVSSTSTPQDSTFLTGNNGEA